MQIRPATVGDAEAIAATRVAAWRESYVGILSAAFLEGMDAVEQARRWRGYIAAPLNAGTFVAVQQGEVVGFASGVQQRHAELAAVGYAAEIATLYVLRRAQRRGLGRGLMAALAGSFVDHGLCGAALWTFAANLPARRFYAALGGEACGTQTTEIAGQQVPEVAYGWRDLDALVRTASPAGSR